jgi:L-lactate dehydrogenase complex protein LldE
VRVGLFVTCLIDLVRPRIGFAALELLEAAGCEVVVPQAQTCCGQPGYNAGDRATALNLARKVLAEFEGLDYIVVPSGSCAGMMRTHYAELFRDAPGDLARVERFVGRVHELSDFLVHVARFQPNKKIPSKAITYHDSCAGLRELGVKAQPRALLAGVEGVVLKEMEECEACCGFGGAFAVKFGDISAHIADRKCEQIAATGADAVVLSDLGCMLNIEGRLRRRGDMKTEVLHIAEILTTVNTESTEK